jgi:dolichyl-phosphate beta-glucosyltransferase
MLDVTLEYLNTNRKDITRRVNAVGGCRSSELLIQYEFIIVNDGSTDDTESIVRKYALEKVKSGDIVKLISLHKNCGKGGAVKIGTLKCSGQLCLMLDADGATDIADGLPKVLNGMKDLVGGNTRRDVCTTSILPPAAVFGSRAHLERESSASRSKIRTFLMHSFHFFVKILCSPRIKDTQCGFKLFTRSAAILLFTNLHLRRWAFDTEVVVIAEKLNVCLAEVGVVWQEIKGSKLDVDKITLAVVSLGMLRDMVCVRLCYLLGIWKLKR